MKYAIALFLGLMFGGAALAAGPHDNRPPPTPGVDYSGRWDATFAKNRACGNCGGAQAQNAGHGGPGHGPHGSRGR